jgi:hypothetical protein
MRGLKSLVVVCGLVLASALLWSALATVSRPAFDRAAWIEAADHENAIDHPRAAMVAEVLDSLEVGVSRAAVEEMLGPAGDGRDLRRLEYGVGASGFGVDYDVLVIEFDASGRMTRAFIEQG